MHPLFIVLAVQTPNQIANQFKALESSHKLKQDNKRRAPMDLKESQTKAEPEKNKAEQEVVTETNRVGGQLTFFYNGSVIVFDGVTSDKAQAVKLIAAAASAVSGGKVSPAAVAAAALTTSLWQQSSSVAAVGSTLVAANGSSLCKLQADLPIARRHSLRQFLEMRRNRLVSKAPYAPAK